MLGVVDVEEFVAKLMPAPRTGSTLAAGIKTAKRMTDRSIT
jgi:hypothetical protein